MRSAMTTKMQSSAKPAMTVLRSARLQRKCACGGTSCPTGECEPCRKKRVQRATNHPSALNSESFVVPAIVDEVLNSAGQPLDAPIRAFMEPRFGHDFGQARIHTDAKAADSARAVNALAYTVGRDIVFGDGQYARHTSAGQKLLAHELTHVAQQQAGSESSSESTRPLEDQAEAFARIADSSVEVGNSTVLAAPVGIQRKALPDVVGT